MKDTLISVIVPVYNVEQYLEACLNSILDQSYRHIEVIVIDDGSTDESSMICDAYAQKDPRIHLIRQENAGLSAARNAGLACVHGEYVTFVDSDDMLVPGAIATMIQSIRSAGADMCICGTIYRNFFREVKQRRLDNVIYEGHDVLKAYLTGKCITPTAWAKMYEAALFREIRFPVGKIYEDAFVLPEILGIVKRTVCISDCLYVQNIRRNSITQSVFSRKRLDIIECEDHLMEYVNTRFPAFLELVVYRKADAIASVMSKILSDMSYGTYGKLYHKLQAELRCEYEKAAAAATANSPVRRMTTVAYVHPCWFACRCLCGGIVGKMKTGIYLLVDYFGK